MRKLGLLGMLPAALSAGLWVGGCATDNSAKYEEAASAHSQIVGRPAPDFTLPDQNDKQVSLKDFRGQWLVLYFYPKDDTPACTCEATEFTKLMGGLRAMNASVLGISADSVATHKFFADKYKLDLTLLSDRDRKVMADYGAWVDTSLGGKKYGRVIRSTMVVGPQGVIRYHWPEVIPEGHAERVKQRLAQLQATAAAGGDK